jgi:hypothetical protein
MGDNRDNSMDSRFPAIEGGGIGLVPQDNLVGRATIVMWSTDGSANWFLPWTWFGWIILVKLVSVSSAAHFQMVPKWLL